MYDDTFHDPMYALMKWGENAYNGLTQMSAFKDFARERFMNMVQNCKIYYSGGNMYVQVDKYTYRQITHDVLRRFENVSFVNIHYMIIEQYPDDVPYCVVEDVMICTEVKEAVIAIHQLSQYIRLFSVLHCKMPNTLKYTLPPMDVKVQYLGGETECYPDIILFNDCFFHLYEEVDPNAFISV